jgi:pimeloyl-ACP methyl ester carboxylesterase
MLARTRRPCDDGRGWIGPTVLLVEADADERGLFGTWLEEEGFGLLTCPGPTEPDYTCIGARRRGDTGRSDLEALLIFEFHGLPSPRQAETTSNVFLRDHEIHRITVDRPGVGFSDPLSQRKLVDWPDDVVQLADRLG